jgi:hypothetical protein
MTNETRISVRDIPPRATWALEQGGVHPLLARLYAARGIRGIEELDTRSSALLSPDRLKGADAAAALLADAIASGRRILIVADYDCDGATGCAVGLRALRMMGAVGRLPGARPLHAWVTGFRWKWRNWPRLRQPDLVSDGRQRHRQRRGRRGVETPRHCNTDHRPPPAGR